MTIGQLGGSGAWCEGGYHPPHSCDQLGTVSQAWYTSLPPAAPDVAKKWTP